MLARSPTPRRHYRRGPPSLQGEDRRARDPLPRRTPQGRSDKCDGCDVPIRGSDIEDEFDFADGRRIRLHRDCSIEWIRQMS